MTSKYSNKNGVKLLSAVLVFAVAFAGVAIVFADESSATTDTTITGAKNYTYPTETQYTYIGTINVSDNTVYPTYTMANITSSTPDGKAVMTDFARFMGAMYRGNTGDNVPTTITYNDKAFTWDVNKGLKGSNWVDSNGKTLVSTIFDDASLTNLPVQDIIMTVEKADKTTFTLSYKITLSVSALAGNTGLQAGLSAGAENFFLSSAITIGSSETLTIPGEFEILGTNGITNNGTIVFQEAGADNTNALSIDGKITNNKIVSGPGWTYDATAGSEKLTLSNYNGNQYFWGYLKTVELEGNNVITASTENSEYRSGHHGLISTYSGTTSAYTMTIQPKTAGTTPSLIINQIFDEGYGIGAWTKDNSVASITIKNVSIEISEGGNRGIYGYNFIFGDDTLTDSKMDTSVSAYGYEKAIRSYGTIDIKQDAAVTAALGTPEQNNNQGDDDYFGVKAETSVTVTGMLTTQGLNTPVLTCSTGKTIVTGDYEQNPDADINVIISGLYLSTLSNSYTVKKISSSSAATAAGIYIIGDVGTYGKITVTEGSKTLETTATDAAGVTSGLASADKVTVTSALTTGIITVPEGKELVLAAGATGGSIDVKGDIVVPKGQSVTATITNGTGNSASFSGVSGSYTIRQGSIDISGTITGGTISNVNGAVNFSSGTISGTVTVNVTNPSTATITLGDGLTIADNGRIIINGQQTTDGKNNTTVLVLEGSTINLGTPATGYPSIGLTNANMSIMGSVLGTNGIINASEKSNVYVDTGAIVTAQFAGTGNFYVDDAMREFKISQDIVSDVTTTAQQKVYIEKSITIYPGAKLTIAGELIVAEGMKITVKDGGQLIINGVNATAQIAGEIIVEGKEGFSFNGKSLTVDGAITLKADSTTAAATVSGKTIINGTVTIGSKSKAVFNSGITVNENGKLQIDGTVSGNVESNYGNVIINGTATTFTVYMQNGGVVSIQSINGTVTVSDENMVLTSSTKVAADKANSLDVKKVQGITVTSGVKVTTKTDGTKTYTNQMFISGTASDIKSSTEGKITVKTGTVTLKSDATLDLGKVAMQIDTDSTFSVAGKIIATNEDFRGFSGAGAVKVTGEIKTRASEDIEDNLSGLQAVKYTVKENDIDFNIYTTLAAAIAAEAKELQVIGLLTIAEDTTVPAGYEVRADAGILVKEDVTLTVAKGSEVSTTTITVDGTLLVENNDDLTSGTIYSDTSAVTETTGRYTNITKALQDAQSGETVKITKKAATEALVYIKSDISVKEGVTLEVPAGKALVISEGVVFTVDGKLYLNNGKIYANNYETSTAVDDITGSFGTTAKTVAGVPQAAVIIANGTIESTYSIAYGTIAAGTGIATDGYAIAGAYYTIKTKSFISPVETAADLVSSIFGKTIDINGKNVVGSVEFIGTETEGVTVTIMANASVDAESMIVKNGTITAIVGAKVNGTFGNAVGALALVNMKAAGTNFVFTDAYNVVNGENVQVLRISGGLQANQTDIVKGASVTLNGKIEVISSGVSIDATYLSSITAPSTNVYKAGSIYLSESADVVIKKVGSNIGSLTFAGSQSQEVTVTIDGSISALNGASLTMDKAVVNGTLTEGVADAAGNVAGIVTVDTLYVGITSKAISTGTAATVNGMVGVTNLMYVLDGSSIPEDLVKDKDSITYTVEGKNWFTVYKIGGSTSNVTVNKFPVEEAALLGWKVKDKYEDSDHPYVVSFSGQKTAVAVIDYYVYSVKVIADPGIDAVYIDNVIMEGVASAHNSNTFTANVKAGDHTITYILANGYSGTAKMVVNGSDASGYKFTAGGEFSTAANTVEYNITLQGIEKSGYVPESPDTPITPSEKDDGMGIIEYLLIVLVILAAILVVVVAIRMMRS